MCGICGFTGQQNKQILERMTNVLEHRGPDEFGYYVNDDVSLGHRRLSIIDLAGGHQPIFNETKSIVTVYNGEIYNFLSIREELISKGHKFYTNTDTEIIVHLYEEYGIDFVSQLNGCFTFAIWDNEKKELYIGVDRTGIKQVYYYYHNGQLIFASEIKSILQHTNYHKEINYQAIDYYLSFRYVPSLETIFKNIYRLKPGHFIKFDFKYLKVLKYWEYNINPELNDEDDCKEKFEELLNDSVRLRLMGDVPYGAYLSGGIDSGVIVGLMNKYTDKPVNTYSVGFGYQGDELHAARKVATHFSTNHQEILIKQEHLKLLPEIIWKLDEPLGDSIIIPQFLLSKLARETVKIILAGDGADEILGGYEYVRVMYLLEKLSQRLPIKRFREIISRIMHIIPVKFFDYFFNYPESLGYAGRERLVLYMKHFSQFARNYNDLTSVFNTENKKGLYSDSFKKRLVNAEKETVTFIKKSVLDYNHYELFDLVTNFDFHIWMQNNTLQKSDRLAMANSVENRVPYLDPRIIDFTRRLPANMKIKGKENKYILRKLAAEILPETLYKTSKHPFYAPVETSFGKTFFEFVHRYLNKETVEKRGLFNYDYIKHIINNRQKSVLLYERQIMSLIIIEIWFQVFVDN